MYGVTDSPSPVPLRPRFSIVVPAYNEAAYLGRTLRSLQQQDFRGLVEIIVVDNNSTDATAEIARAFDVRVLFEPHPGVCWARQCGTAAALGDIVVSTDADTTHPPDWLSRIDAIFATRPDVVAVGGPCRFVDGPQWSVIYPRVLFGSVHACYRLTRGVPYVTATNLAFRRSAWTRYDTVLTQGGDELDQLRRLRSLGRIVFDRTNTVMTSARRLQRGLVYNIVVTLLFYYMLGYFANRLLARRLLPTAPHFRSERVARPHVRFVVAALGWLAFVIFAADPDFLRAAWSWR